MLIKDPEFVRNFLNLRNAEGQSPLFLTIEHGRQEMFDILFSKFKNEIDFRSKD